MAQLTRFPIISTNYIIYSEAFYEVIDPQAAIALVAETPAHEGPVYYAPWDSLLYTTPPVTTNLPLKGYKTVSIGCINLATGCVSTFRVETNLANGMTLCGDQLLICEQGSFATPAGISAIDLTQANGLASVVVNRWDGLQFNSPNDVVVKDDGTIWFTDPSYGYLQGFKFAPQLGDYVYRYDPATGYVTAVADGFSKPNGIAFSPDYQTLYVTDSGAIQGPDTYFVDLPHHVEAFDISPHNTLSGRRLFAVVNPAIPDGIKCDTQGRVYVSSGSGVKVYEANGALIGEIRAPGVANFTFGGKKNDTLFMCVDTAVYSVTLKSKGAK